MSTNDGEISFYKGDAIKLKFHVIDDEGDDLDLTDYDEMYFVVKEEKTDPMADELMRKTIVDFDFTDITHGRMELQLIGTDTNSLTAGTYWYELFIYNGTTGFGYSVLQDRFTILQDVLF